MIISPLLVLIYVFCETAQPALMGKIIDDGIMKEDMQTILQTGGKMLLFALTGLIVAVGNLYCASRTGTGFAANLREKLFYKIQQFSFADIDKFSTPSLITRLTNDTTVLQQVVQRAMLLLYRAPLMMIVAFFFVVRINGYIAGLIAGAIPLLGICIFLLLKKGYPLFIKVQEKLDELNRAVRENLINIKVVKSFVREDFEEKKFDTANVDYRETSVKAINVIIFAIPLMQLIMNVIVIAILWMGGANNMKTEIEIGKLVSIVNYSFQILMSLMMVTMTIMMFARASASSERIVEVLDASVSIANSEDAINEHHQIEKGKIVFKNVSFKYDLNSENNVLKEIDFTINPGEVVALVGGTGSAKSTLLQLIPRLYDVTEGELFLDDINVKEYSLKELRNSIGVVLQKNELFSGTIMSNLKWGNPNASDEELFEAAKIAEAHPFITSFPDGYDTILEQGGVNLSGGQKQRICLARTLLKKPKILLLDNSTSAVDTDTERRISQNLKQFLKDTTVLIVTQRFSSMENSDRIVLLEAGKIEAVGEPHQLLKESKIFKEIYDSQVLPM